ncbi:MAG TPA: hypothetical protein PKN36_11570, partial [bacterium]|nr:hypothetical protein [bacterium]
LIYNQRLEQLNAQDNRGGKYTFMYGLTHQGMPADQIDDMGVKELVGYLQLGEIAIGATINRFLVDNGNNILYGWAEHESDGAVPLASMTGLGLSPSSAYSLGYGVDHESYYEFHAQDTARKTFEALGFKTNPLYDPPEVTFTYPVEDEPLETEEDGDVTILGTLNWKGPRKFEGGVKDIKLFKYTYLQEMVNGFDWQGVEVEVDDENWAIDDTGDFSVFCNIPQADRVYALRVVFVFKDDTEMQAVVMLGPPDELETKSGGETIKWSMEGLGKVFALDNETYVYEEPKQGETPPAVIYGSIVPAFRQDDSTYILFSGKYSMSGGDPIAFEQNEVRWEAGFEEPDGLNLLEIDFSTFYEDRNIFLIAYDMIRLSEPEILKRVAAFLIPWPKREKEDLLPPYCRPQEIPEEE